jgi:hypothetical protein
MRNRISPAFLFRSLEILLVMLLLVLGTERASAYSCGNPSSGHCYGVTQWTEHPEYFGAYSDISQVSMGCPSGCNGFVDDETWLTDSHTASCVANSFGMCWVEAGYFFTDGSSSRQYFWAEAKPSGAFTLHTLGTAGPNGAINHYMLIKDARTGPGIFQVWIYNTSLSTLYHGTSSGNGMAGDRVIIGQELAGSSGASASTAHFTRNIWAVKPLGPEYVFWYNRQVNDGSVTSHNPPFASWAVHPSTPPPPEGGDFTTHCCK